MDRYVHVTYCEDIRQEVGNKKSFMGIFSGAIFVPFFPFLLPKLCLAIHVSTPADKPFESLKLRVLRDDDLIWSHELDADQIKTFRDCAPDPILENDAQPIARRALNLEFVLANFVIESPTKIKLRADTEAGELRGAALRIVEAPLNT